MRKEKRVNQSGSGWGMCQRRRLGNVRKVNWGENGDSVSNSVAMCFLARSSGKASKVHKLELRLFFQALTGFEIYELEVE